MAGRSTWILGDQLSLDNPALEGADRVVMVESEAKLRAGRFHRQKLHLLLSAMRHFADELRAQDIEVDYRRARSLAEGLRAHVAAHRPAEVALLEPANAVGRERLAALEPVRLVRGTLFLTHPSEFADWAEGRRRIVMEDFYRWQRRRLDLLMDDGGPAGGRWNFDVENREPPAAAHSIPASRGPAGPGGAARPRRARTAELRRRRAAPLARHPGRGTTRTAALRLPASA